MSEPSLPNRRDLLAASAAAGALSVLPVGVAKAADGDAIRPFRVNIPEEELVDLRRRIAATRWPEKETDGSPLADPGSGISALVWGSSSSTSAAISAISRRRFSITSRWAIWRSGA